ncbi:hypothetical protein MRB53_010553 [Persea americana]|uniref:Uncharacterized protein n=1 Tax=Persea americana TaxID=3435 RepID=A0ACC2LSA5_PERAE|nr:hypothetical protein MRB53_010553 [Persea americana]
MTAREADTPEEDPRQSERTQLRREHVVLEEEPEELKKDPEPTKEPEKPIEATSPRISRLEHGKRKSATKEL